MINGNRVHQRGTEIIEFAITAPLLFVLLFGIIEFSVALFDKATITNASREGARTGILYRPDPRNLAAETNTIDAVVNNYAQAYLISLGGSSSLSVRTTRTDLNANGVFDVGDQLTVTVTYPYRFLILPQFVSSLADMTLSATTVMRAE